MKVNDSSYRIQNQLRPSERNSQALIPWQLRKQSNKFSRNHSPRKFSPQSISCSDTAGRYFLLNDSVDLFVTHITQASDNNILVSGEFIKYQPYRAGGFLLKCNDTGAIDWIKQYDTLENNTRFNYFWYFFVKELSGGRILLVGKTNNTADENADLLLTLTDNNGVIIWSHSYKSRFWTRGSGSADYLNVTQVVEDVSSGDVYLTAGHWDDGSNISRFNMSNGNLVWSNTYTHGTIPNGIAPYGIDVSGNELISFIRTSAFYIIGTRINKNTGDTISTRSFHIIDPQAIQYILYTPSQITRLSNGNFIVSGHLGTSSFLDPPPGFPRHHFAVMEFDNALNFIRADAYSNNNRSNGTARISINPDGSGFYSLLSRISSYTGDMHYVNFKRGEIIKQRARRYSGEGIPLETQALRLRKGTDLIVKLLGDSTNNVDKVEFLNLSLNDSASECLGFNTTENAVTSFELEVDGRQIFTIEKNDLYRVPDKSMRVQDGLPLNHSVACKQVNVCDSFTLSTNADSLCINTTAIVNWSRSPGCKAVPIIQYDTAVIKSLRKINDSTFEVSFKKAGTTYFRGSLLSCLLVEDSLPIHILQSPGTLNLGVDSIICPGNSIRKTLSSGYRSYRWQDGSTDSFFNITLPGKYWADVIDSCGNKFSDTLLIAAHPPIPFDIGADITICEKDTVSIMAPSSFINYKWSPAYNLLDEFNQTVKVFPSRNTIYHVMAEKIPGCFVYDSVLVKVKSAPPISLGTDQTFCSGDSLMLDAGGGFSNYQWSNGATTRGITVKAIGSFSVLATTTDGCKSRDTIRVMNVFPNPTVNLGSDSIICVGASRQLDAGNYNNYLWNTGETSRSININTTGQFIVSVKDNNGCSGTDTLLISKAVSPPKGFLQVDTTICNYAKLTLGPKSSFMSYNWNSNQNTREIVINKAGIYWLQVKDQYNCEGRDSIEIAVKECLKGFYAPNAFTPNRDGKNDGFRPLIFGSLVKYELKIFNRWGQLIFTSKDYSQAWNGNAYPVGTFAWICHYQFENENVQTKSGTVTLLR